MPIGLRQGCVLSPILFALYLADLGRILETSRLGVRLNTLVCPGMFFADDMVLCGDTANMHALLKIVKDYSLRNKLEFSGEKSVVLTYGAGSQSIVQPIWDIGIPPHKDKLQQIVTATPAKKGKYLGVWFSSGGQHAFMEHHKTMTLTAIRLSNIMGALVRGVNNPIGVLGRLWNVYAIPCIFYGAEVISFTQTLVDRIEVIQRALIRSSLRLPQCTAIEALYLLTGLYPVRAYIMRAKLNYFTYVSSLSADRWVFQAYMEQHNWLLLDNGLEQVIAGPPHLVNTYTYRLNTYWMAEVAYWYNTLGYATLAHLSKQSVRLNMIRDTWDFILKALKETLRDGSPNPAYKVTMRYVDDNPALPDWGYHRHKHVWWLRAKLDSIFLNAKKKPGRLQKQGLDTLKLCPMCGIQEETLYHFLCECEKYPPFPTRLALLLLPWWFSCSRSDGDRTQLSALIGHRWSIRERYIVESVCGPDPIDDDRGEERRAHNEMGELDTGEE